MSLFWAINPANDFSSCRADSGGSIRDGLEIWSGGRVVEGLNVVDVQLLKVD